MFHFLFYGEITYVPYYFWGLTGVPTQDFYRGDEWHLPVLGVILCRFQFLHLKTVNQMEG